MEIPSPAAMIQATPTPESTPTQKPEERADHTKANTERFYEATIEDYGFSQQQAQNWFDKVTEDPDFSQMPRSVGCQCRGFYDPQIVTYEGRKAIQYSEYLYGEGGIAHGVGSANFILVWDEDGNGSVADWWVDGWLRNGG